MNIHGSLLFGRLVITGFGEGVFGFGGVIGDMFGDFGLLADFALFAVFEGVAGDLGLFADFGVFDDFALPDFGLLPEFDRIRRLCIRSPSLAIALTA